MNDEDTADALEVTQQEDPTDLNDDWEDSLADVYDNPGEVFEGSFG